MKRGVKGQRRVNGCEGEQRGVKWAKWSEVGDGAKGAKGSEGE